MTGRTNLQSLVQSAGRSSACLAAAWLCAAATAQPTANKALLFPPKIGQVVHYTDGSSAFVRRYVNGMPLFCGTTNAVAQLSVSAPAIKPGGISGLNLTGSGVRIGLWEAGGVPNTIHPELAGRLFVGELPPLTVGLTSHATHVCGTLIGLGLDPAAAGFAPGATVSAFQSINDLAEMNASYGSGLRISNHSYGNVCGFHLHESSLGSMTIWHGDVSISTTEDWKFGFYDDESANTDLLLWNNRLQLPVVAAGNDRNDDRPTGTGPESWTWVYAPGLGHYVPTGLIIPKDGGPSGFDTIPCGMTLAKNLLTVGSVEDVPGGWTVGTPVTLSSFSSIGPTDDGRIKPDVVANGSGLYSTSLIAEGVATPFVYEVFSGTSMAAPGVTGTLALLLEMFNRGTPLTEVFNSTLKGLIIHTANDVGNIGPDYKFGWGLVNARDAATLIGNFAAGSPSAQILQGVYRPAETYRWSVTPIGGDVRITLCYTDLPGTPSAISVDPPGRKLVNDLDMTLEQRFGSFVNIYRPWVLNPSIPDAPAVSGDNDVDNVEQIVAQLPAPSPTVSYELTLTHELYNMLTNTRFSLIVSGARLERLP